MPAQQYRLVFADSIRQHLAAIERKHHSLIRQTMREQLSYEPFTETRNRKPIPDMTPFGMVWELRFGPQNCFRVLYSGDASRTTVFVVAIGVKDRDVLWIGGEVIDL
jgi:mRNA-degrading endonuclease RelE of RelBE toxin-antitoxin system